MICVIANENAGKIFSKDYIKKFDALHIPEKVNSIIAQLRDKSGTVLLPNALPARGYSFAGSSYTTASVPSFADIANTLRKHYGEDNHGT
jgi:hypothetical protein